MTANADQIAFWNVAGEVWAALQVQQDRFLAPLGEAAMRTLSPRPGERLVDIGCGAGATTLALAEAVGATGAAVGIDISRALLQAARASRRPADAGALSFLEADAQTDPFPPPPFDAAFSRFGVMFFDDPVAAFRNIAAGLKPGGRLAFVCWRSAAENRLFAAATQVRLKHSPSPPEAPDPGAPGPFAFSDPERVRRILAGAGFGQIEITPFDAKVTGGDLEQTTALIERLGLLGPLLDEHPDRRGAVMADLSAGLTPYLRDGAVRLPAAAWIVAAHT